jgi:glycosyltransferase involved in cell wall biosynthesis
VTLAQEMQDRGIVHLHNHIAKSSCTVAMLASELSGIPFSFTLHGPDIFFEPHHWRLDAKIARASFVACISEFCRSQAMLFSDRIHWDKLHIVHCGIDPARYDGPPGGDGPILFVGRLASVKGIPVLLDAMRLVRKAQPKAELVLIGDGPERPAIETAVRADADLSSAVAFAGYQSQDAVARYLASSSMLVLPSFAEGVPVVLMEAMAAGKPVIASQVGGVAELVRDGTSGSLVPAGDDRALEAAITELLCDPIMRQRMGEAGRKTVMEDFDAMEEAARLGILFVSYHTSQTRPAKRPGGVGE